MAKPRFNILDKCITWSNVNDKIKHGRLYTNLTLRKMSGVSCIILILTM